MSEKLTLENLMREVMPEAEPPLVRTDAEAIEYLIAIALYQEKRIQFLELQMKRLYERKP